MEQVYFMIIITILGSLLLENFLEHDCFSFNILITTDEEESSI